MNPGQPRNFAESTAEIRAAMSGAPWSVYQLVGEPVSGHIRDIMNADQSEADTSTPEEFRF